MASGEHSSRRREQQVKWMWSMLEERITSRLRSDPAVRNKLPNIERAVAGGTLSPMLAVEEIAAAAGL
jgi:LAO/AO transport system kinase